MNEETLDMVAGGNGLCEETYQEGEWCWLNDACSLVITYYPAMDTFTDQQEDEYSCLENAWSFIGSDKDDEGNPASGGWTDIDKVCRGNPYMFD